MGRLALDGASYDWAERTFVRLNRLLKRGYVLDDVNVMDAIWLKSLSGGPALIMYPDGKIVRLNGEFDYGHAEWADQDRIYNTGDADDAIFDRFVRSLREPNWRERTAPDRNKYIWTPLVGLAAIGVFFGLGRLIEVAWRAL